MESDLLARLDLGAVAIAMLVLGAVVSALVIFLRQNRKDLDILEEELESESADDDEDANDSKPGNRL
ncbi:MAG: hypothetical protein WAS49_03815 [Candidatus Dechloromonas phosphoritropha]|jgi:hypothetical protein